MNAQWSLIGQPGKVLCKFNFSGYVPEGGGQILIKRYEAWPNKSCVTRNFQSVCKTNNLIGQTSKAHQSKQSDWSNCTHCAPRLGAIEINFRFRATKLPLPEMLAMPRIFVSGQIRSIIKG